MRRIILVVFSLFIALVALLVSDPAMAQVYKWVDKDGGVHFSNVPTSEGEKKPEPILNEKELAQKECIQPNYVSGPGGGYYDNYAWRKYRECLNNGGVDVLPWKKK
ncbi:MAG: DUF4124 domain-containing protein [Deltaproteobacteria bacterium]|nr:DUF4124 domain-containing protein [Deltaproteobacteria bacterium]